jgi:hypothetical protein
MPLSQILTSQATWAQARWGSGLDGRNAPSVEDNLFQPIAGPTWNEFAAGDGDELGLSGRPAKMRSLRSSSALACNVFHPWRGGPLTSLAQALGLAGNFVDLRFEQKLSHGLRGHSPNLDVVLYPSEGAPVGVESKFAEIYGQPKPEAPLKGSYFAGKRRWADLGMPRCQLLAERIGRETAFRRLAAGQLLKHLLGLATTHAQRPARLVYIWYDCRCNEAEEHRREVEVFKEAIGDEIEFTVLTYQELFERLRLAPEPCPDYYTYLARRYFSAAT